MQLIYEHEQFNEEFQTELKKNQIYRCSVFCCYICAIMKGIMDLLAFLMQMKI